MTPTPDPRRPAGVSRHWRTATLAIAPGLVALVLHDRGRRLPPPSPLVREPASDPRLDRPLDAVDFDRVRLADALAELGRRAGVAVAPRWDDLAAAKVTPDTPVTVHLRRATFATALDALLAQAGGPVDPDVGQAAVWDERASVVTVGTAEHAAALADPPVTRVYDVARLVEAIVADGGSLHVGPPLPTTTIAVSTDPSAGRTLDDAQGAVRKYLTDHVRPTSWMMNGGDAGSIEFWAGLLVVGQTPGGHHDVDVALRAMRGGG